MKKLLTTILTCAMAFGIALFAPTALQANEIGVTIDGIPVDFEGQPPAIVDGRTLVPVRGVFEALGFYVSWYGPSQTVILAGDDHIVIISIGDDFFATNGVEFPLDVPAQIIEGRTLVPIRAMLESVGYDVDWDESTNTVLVTTPPEDFVGFNFAPPDNLDLDRLAFNAEMFSWVTVTGALREFGSISLGENGVIDMHEHGITAASIPFTPEDAGFFELDASAAAFLVYYMIGGENAYYLRSFTTFDVSAVGTSAIFEIPIYFSFNNSLNVAFYMGQEKPDGYVYSAILVINFGNLDEVGLAALEDFSTQVGYDFLRTAVDSIERFFGVLSFVDGMLQGD